MHNKREKLMHNVNVLWFVLTIMTKYKLFKKNKENCRLYVVFHYYFHYGNIWRSLETTKQFKKPAVLLWYLILDNYYILGYTHTISTCSCYLKILPTNDEWYDRLYSCISTKCPYVLLINKCFYQIGRKTFCLIYFIERYKTTYRCQYIDRDLSNVIQQLSFVNSSSVCIRDIYLPIDTIFPLLVLHIMISLIEGCYSQGIYETNKFKRWSWNHPVVNFTDAVTNRLTVMKFTDDSGFCVLLFVCLIAFFFFSHCLVSLLSIN